MKGVSLASARSVALATLTLLLPSPAIASPELVRVLKVSRDQVVVARNDGATYLVRKDIGCMSLPLREGRHIVVVSPGRFLGVGAKLLISEALEECRVLSAAPLGEDEVAKLVAEEVVAFFDERGQASAFVDPAEEGTFYLWTGEAVAYISGDDIYGFNGRHLGWLSHGMVFDHAGAIIAAPRSAFRIPVAASRNRSPRGRAPARAAPAAPPAKPAFGQSWSRVSPRSFFLRGID